MQKRAIKINLAMDIDTLMKESDKFMFEDAKIQSKAMGLLDQARKLLASANADPKILLDEYQAIFSQLSKIGVEPPKALLSRFQSFRKESLGEAKIKKAVLAKLFEIDKIFGGGGI